VAEYQINFLAPKMVLSPTTSGIKFRLSSRSGPQNATGVDLVSSPVILLTLTLTQVPQVSKMSQEGSRQVIPINMTEKSNFLSIDASTT
jgi:hypothetical protein